MSTFLAELLGTATLVLFGDGVVAGVALNKSKAKDGGWIVVTMAWAMGVAVAAWIFGPISGGHFNPALTIALAAIGNFSWSLVPSYIAGQMLGGILGAVIVWLAYLAHWKETDNKATKLGVFCTAPAIRNVGANLITEIIGTFLLVFGILGLGQIKMADGFGPFTVGILILILGLSYGGPTGYAINPARDLGPRIAHAILPIAGKGDSDWGYSWIPVVGPIIGALLGGLLFTLVF